MFLYKPKSLLTGLLAILSLATGPLLAGQVTLNSTDGTVSMSGELLEFDGTSYLLGMQIGEISIEASQVVCVGEACPNLAAGLTAFSIAGSEAMGRNLLPTLIEVFALDRGGDLEISTNADGSLSYNVLDADGGLYASITIQANDTVNGFAGLMEGSASIVMAARRIRENELAAFELSGKGRLDSAAQERILALDAVIIAVNPQNPVQILSLAQLGGVFEGEITNWSQLGGRDAAITLYRPEETLATSQRFFEVAMAVGDHAYARSATVLASDAAVSDAVAADENGIGISSYAQQRNAKAVTLRSVCGQLFEPTEYAIKTEEYPLTERLYLYTAKGAVPDVATAFMAFATSSAAQSVIRNSGFVDQSLGHATLDAQGRRLAQAIVSASGRRELLQLQDLTSIMLDADRLSFTLRYGRDGQLDARAQADIVRLAALIRNGDFSSRQMLALGFSDNAGAVNAALSATQTMAQNVRDAIVVATGRANLGNLRISPIGYGRLMPQACNDTQNGRDRNNRVEIWVK